MTTVNPIENEMRIPRTALRQERGVALLMTIFGLLLLTAVAVAMMYSSDSETMISVNYRDKQVATYSAVSGLQEARQRVHPIFGDLATANLVPTQIPTTANGQVLYILNPDPTKGETVASIAPWLYTIGGKVNPYFDQELCQENMMGLVGTHGVACTGAAAVPAANCSVAGSGGGGWCAYYDNSAHTTAWKLANPMDYKWVRVTLKEDWNTPAYVPNPTLASGKQVCWDGGYQNQIPTGYGTNCQSSAGNTVIGLNLANAGSGYTSAPTVQISGGGGSGAAATAQIAPAPGTPITSVTLTSGGSGYTAQPNVIISPAGATFQAVVANSPVTGVQLSGSNYCYDKTSTPTVSFSASPLSNNATATATMNLTGCINSVSVSGKCSNTTAGRSYVVTASSAYGGGSGFAAGTATFSNSHKLSGVTISSVGSGYSDGVGSITIVDDGGSNCTIGPSFSTGRQIQSIAITNGGAYMAQPTVTLGGATAVGTAPTGTAKPSPWPATASSITAINITSGGSGYSAGNYTLTITPSNGAGSGATAYATATGGSFVISGFQVTNGGSGYTSAPNVTVTNGGGTGASAVATIAAGSSNTAMGAIYLLTSLAETRTGAKSMAQMEVGVRPPFTFNLGGAITLAGPSPAFVSPNSNNFTVNGNDANSCHQTASAAKPAIGVWDSTSQASVISALGKPQNYTGAGGTPSVENVYASLGGADVTPANLDGFIQNMQSYATSPILTGNVSGLPATTTSSVTYVNGNLTLSGNPTGNGVLIVTGTLTFSGDFTWNGIVLVIGQGQVVHNGGGNGTFTGAIYVAQTKDAAGNLLPVIPGQPQYTWNGGGTNSIQYDHCLADGLLQKYQGQPSTYPLQVLSTRTLQF
jgi:hypothetical protein